MKILRTPDQCFDNLPDYPFAPHYAEIEPGLRLHYVEEGPPDAPVVLMLHGEPTWSYLYRFMVPPVAQAGFRVLAPDMIGFGKSDKPACHADHSYERQVGWIARWIESLDLRDITLVCQDWGSLIGLRVAAEAPERFARIILSNGGLPDGTRFSKAFDRWRLFARHSPWFPVGRIVQWATKRRLSTAERRAYDAPFPSAAYKVAPRIYPSLVPIDANDPATPANLRAWEIFASWTKPFVTCFSDGDPITRGMYRPFHAKVPGAKGGPNIDLAGGHFIQEDDPQGFVRVVLAAS
jgi:haloalkane dehalogenase